MKIILLIVTLLSVHAWSGSLYTFEKNIVVLNALTHIHSRYSDLAKLELESRSLNTNIGKNGKLFATLVFTYREKDDSELLFVCAKVGENGELINIERDIKARKGVAGILIPEKPGCWGKP